MRGLLLDNLTGLVGDVFKGVANSTASAKIIGPAVAQSKNKKRREERGRSKKGNQYCGFCKDFFRLDL